MEVGWFEIINIIMCFQLIVFSFFLFLKKKNRKSNLLLGIFLFAEAAAIFNILYFHQFRFFFNKIPYLLLTGYPFCFLWGPSFYLYVKSLVYPDFKAKLNILIHLIPFTVLTTYLLFSVYVHDASVKMSVISSPSYLLNIYSRHINILLISQVTFYNILALIILYNYRQKLKGNLSSLTKTGHSWLIYITVGYTISHIISVSMNLAAFSDVEFYNQVRILVFITFFIFFNIIFFRGWYHPEIFSGGISGEPITGDNYKQADSRERYKTSKLTKTEAESLIKKLDDFIKIKKPYLNPELTLNQLADSLELQPRILSQIINEYFKKNFYDYINGRRIEEAKKLLISASNEMNISEVLYESGFNSKATFNRVFKKETGISPSDYRKKNLHQTLLV